MYKSGYSKNTIEVTATVLSGMFKQAMKNRIIKDNPVAYATLPRKYVINERRVMTLEEQRILLYYAKKKTILGHSKLSQTMDLYAHVL